MPPRLTLMASLTLASKSGDKFNFIFFVNPFFTYASTKIFGVDLSIFGD